VPRLYAVAASVLGHRTAFPDGIGGHREVE
jgi:hypothetical protein